MNDNWRLQVDLHDPKHTQPLLERLDARELQHELSNAFHDRVIVTRDDARIFLYAGSGPEGGDRLDRGQGPGALVPDAGSVGASAQPLSWTSGCQYES